ncbi:MAG: alpha/beta hydrolase, partial [Candidatus Heimdallarchaeaceae archaeon]|jgi:pimeloyl-ACP methyl ester carboxylesterase
MKNEKNFQTLTLKDGRKLGFAESGDPEGAPVFYFHGWLGGRLDLHLAETLRVEINCHLIALDRPGIGLSSYQENREILNWPDDIVELADHLGIDKFHVLGMSGGCPYVAACAYKIPTRLLSAGMIGGMGPYEESKKMLKNPNRILFSLLKKFPIAMKIVLFPMWKRLRKMEFNEKTSKFFAKQGMDLPDPDKKIYENPTFQEFMLFHLKDILQQNSKGPFHDGKLFTKPWNFELEDISPNLKCYVWHGELDKNVSVEIAKNVVSRIPNCEATYYPDEAHISLVVNKISEIIDKLVE